MAATGLLARGWFRGRLGGWLGTAGVLAATLALLVLVSALFTGLQSETESRVADVFTGDLRVTPRSPGVFSGGLFEDGEAAAALIDGATPRMEAQAILSRVSLPAVVGGGEPPTVGREVSLGVLIGVDFSNPLAAQGYEKRVVVGSLPDPWSTSQTQIPVAISLRTLDSFLTDEERDGLSSWPPTIAEIRDMPLEVTAGVARDGDFSNDVYRRQARVVALFDTGVDTLDSFTMWTPIEASRFLLGHGADGTEANALIVVGDTQQAEQVAEEEGWATEGPASFTKRYLGQLLEALRTLSLISAAVLFTIPAFLVAHGVERVLEAQRKEVAVLRAMGVPGATIRRAMGRLVLWTVSIALTVAAMVVVLAGMGLHAILPAWKGAPVPLDVVFTWEAVTAGVGVALLSCLFAFWFAWRGQSKQSLPTELRAA